MIKHLFYLDETNDMNNNDMNNNDMNNNDMNNNDMNNNDMNNNDIDMNNNNMNNNDIDMNNNDMNNNDTTNIDDMNNDTNNNNDMNDSYNIIKNIIKLDNNINELHDACINNIIENCDNLLHEINNNNQLNYFHISKNEYMNNDDVITIINIIIMHFTKKENFKITSDYKTGTITYDYYGKKFYVWHHVVFSLMKYVMVKYIKEIGNDLYISNIFNNCVGDIIIKNNDVTVNVIETFIRTIMKPSYIINTNIYKDIFISSTYYKYMVTLKALSIPKHNCKFFNIK
jgi:hypothetical protein